MRLRDALGSLLGRLPWYRRRQRDEDLERELRDHLDLEAEEQEAAGLAPGEAARAAHLALGNTAKIEEDVRAACGFRWLEILAQNLSYALRMLRKSPGFAAVAILTLALGIGANTAIFSVINAILLRPLPIRDPSRVVVIQENLPKLNLFHTAVDPPGFRKFSEHTDIFESTALFLNKNLNLTGAGHTQRLLAMRATSS